MVGWLTPPPLSDFKFLGQVFIQSNALTQQPAAAIPCCTRGLQAFFENLQWEKDRSFSSEHASYTYLHYRHTMREGF